MGWLCADIKVHHPFAHVRTPPVRATSGGTTAAISLADVERLLTTCGDDPGGRRDAMLLYTAAGSGLRRE